MRIKVLPDRSVKYQGNFTSCKSLTFYKAQASLALCSLNRDFHFVDFAYAQQCSNKFALDSLNCKMPIQRL